MKLKITEYNIGDKVWYHQGQVLVLCTIEQIKKSPDPNMPNLYKIDEPLDFEVSGEQLESSFVRAKKYYITRQEEYKKECEQNNNMLFLPNLDLDQDRMLIIRENLVKTFNREPSPQEVNMQLWLYPPKDHRTEWFNYADLTTD